MLLVLLLHADALQLRVSKRASARARGKKREGPRSEVARLGIARVEVVRQDFALIEYNNGTVAEVHTPSLAQTQHGEWLAVRAALEITASEFAAARDAWKHATREELLRRKMGVGAVFRGNAATAFGLEMEPHAVALYERLTDSKVAALLQTGLPVTLCPACPACPSVQPCVSQCSLPFPACGSVSILQPCVSPAWNHVCSTLQLCVCPSLQPCVPRSRRPGCTCTPTCAGARRPTAWCARRAARPASSRSSASSAAAAPAWCRS